MITAAVYAGSKLVAYGMCLSLGFWITRLGTNKIDELLLMRDKDYQAYLLSLKG